jgi:hypothetical protein
VGDLSQQAVLRRSSTFLVEQLQWLADQIAHLGGVGTTFVSP